MYIVIKKLVSLSITGVFKDFTSVYDELNKIYDIEGNIDNSAIFKIYCIKENKGVDISLLNDSGDSLVFSGTIDSLLFFCSTKKDTETIKSALFGGSDTVTLKNIRYSIKNFRNGLIDISTNDEFTHVSDYFVSGNDVSVDRMFLINAECSFNVFMNHKFCKEREYIQCRCTDIKLNGFNIFEKYNATFELVIDDETYDSMTV